MEETPNQKLNLSFDLVDEKSNKGYSAHLDFSRNLDITVKAKDEFPQKVYEGSFTLDELKKKSRFFKMFDSIADSFNDVKLLQEQKTFFVLFNDNSLTFGIKKQIGIQDDIIFPLVQKSSDIKEVVDELCKKNNELEKKVNDLNERVNQLENDLKMIKSAFFLDSSDENVIKDFFEKKPKAFKLIYNGKDRNNFFANCEGKKNLLFLVKDTKGNKFGGYMSSTLVKNDDLNIKDENSFIFSVQNKKKFKVLNPSKAIHVRSNYLIRFGGDNGGNDFYIGNENGGMNKKETYGDNNNETTNGNSSFTIDEFKVFELIF